MPVVVPTEGLPPFAAAGAPLNTVEQVSAMIRAYCGWHIAPNRVDTFTLDGSGASVQMLPTMHLTAVTSVTADGTLLAADEYQWSESGFLTGRTWPCKPRSVVVEAVHGYDVIPEELAQVTLQVVGRGGNTPLGPTQQAAGPFSVTWGPGGMFTDLERAVLDRYRIPADA